MLNRTVRRDKALKTGMYSKAVKNFFFKSEEAIPEILYIKFSKNKDGNLLFSSFIS